MSSASSTYPIIRRIIGTRQGKVEDTVNVIHGVCYIVDQEVAQECYQRLSFVLYLISATWLRE